MCPMNPYQLLKHISQGSIVNLGDMPRVPFKTSNHKLYSIVYYESMGKVLPLSDY